MESQVALNFLLLMFSGSVNRRQQDVIEYLRTENDILREQLGQERIKFTDDQRHRLAVKGKALGRAILKKLGPIVTPDAILRWYRELIAKKYDGPGRPKTDKEIEDLVLEMARSNSGWGYTKIRDFLRLLGVRVSRNTVKRILKENGIEPAPQRSKRTDWKSFLTNHLEALAATDFFTVEVLTRVGLVRFHVLFVIEVSTRRVEIAGITSQPNEAWMMQIARNLTFDDDGFLHGKEYLVHDRDPLFTEAFRDLLRSADVEPLKLPAKSPNLNPYAERFVRSIKAECLSKMITLGERHLRSAIREFVDHYHRERPHQGLDGNLYYREAV